MSNTSNFTNEFNNLVEEVNQDLNFEFRPGNIFSTNNFGDIRIIKYNDCHNIIFCFVNTGTIDKARSQQIRLGNLKDRYAQSVAGIGVLGNARTTDDNGVTKKSYKHFSNMLERKKSRDSYLNVPIDQSFSFFEYFEEWFDLNFSLYPESLREKLTVDSDILPFVRGDAKAYGSKTCLLIKDSINTSFARLQSSLRKMNSLDESSYEKAETIISTFSGNFEKNCLPYLPDEYQADLNRLETKLWELYFQPPKEAEIN